MNVNVPIVGDPPLGHAKRRAKIRAALQEHDFKTLTEMYRKHGEWHMFEAMDEDASQDERASQLPNLLHQLLRALVSAEYEAEIYRKRCIALTETKKPTTKPDDIPF